MSTFAGAQRREKWIRVSDEPTLTSYIVAPLASGMVPEALDGGKAPTMTSYDVDECVTPVLASMGAVILQICLILADYLLQNCTQQRKN